MRFKLALLCIMLCSTLAAGEKIKLKKALPADSYFEVETLAEGLHDPIEIAISPDDKIFIIERKGAVKLFDPKNGTTRKIHQLDVAWREMPKSERLGTGKGTYAKENGGLGIALDPDFSKNNFVYIYYSAREKSCNRLSRFTLKEGQLQNQKQILEVYTDRYKDSCHEGGSIAFGKDRQLFLSTGDNTCPFESGGYAPIDERPNKIEFDAQRSAGNSNDLRGSVLRIIVNLDGSYSIPKRNLYSVGTPKTRPEIFVKGCRNPYRISTDQKTGHVYWGDVGPDAHQNSPRGPRGYDEFNQAQKAGFYGWPYFRGEAFYSDYNFANRKLGQSFEKKIINDSPNNTGLQTLPATQRPMIWYPYARSENKFRPHLLRGGRNAMAGPVYYQDKLAKSFPPFFDRVVFFYDWMRGFIKIVTLDENHNYVTMTPFMTSHRFMHPIDMEKGPKGDIYILEYGKGWFNNQDGQVRKISFTGFNRKPVIRATVDNTAGVLPLKVKFSSEGTYDPDKDKLAYLWVFANGKTSTKANPVYSYKKAGVYQATLTVTDPSGRKATKKFTIYAGNSRPVVHLELISPKSTFTWGQTLNYKAKAVDREDGKIKTSQIRVTAEYRPDGNTTEKKSTKALDPLFAGLDFY
ncbi:MAG: PQQ-dependent sugar dehydrogenase, partial [Lentisphaeraceae bacterium]|nr:PQQ-dependent sugar dehydrogenase [Lentisphaeraceae bacterium]